MSTNPFRRAEPNAVPSLQLDTKVSHKSVSFKSPDTIIPTDSLPGSPESFRFPQVTPTQIVLPVAPDYGSALHSDPFIDFQDNTRNDATDTVIQEAIQNAQANAQVTTQVLTGGSQGRENAVQDTLSRFASRNPLQRSSGDGQLERMPERRATMDVDAFKRLLLTGESTANTALAPSGQSQLNPMLSLSATSESSSTADSASISQRSLSEPMPPAHEESPRTSTELEIGDANESQKTRPGLNPELKKKAPPPPRPRRGLARATSSMEETTSQPLSLDDHVASTVQKFRPSDDVGGQEVELSEEAIPRRPPTPPLARRKSQHATGRPLMHAATSNPSTRSMSDTNTLRSSSPARAPLPPPPPPPPRRPDSMSSVRRPSLDFSTPEEELAPDASEGLRPLLTSRSSSTPKRSALGPPPTLPAPRRNRASSKSSINSQTASIASVSGNSSRPSTEMQRPTDLSRPVTDAVTAPNILGDLAALQREIDAARAKGVRG